ncbi:hypothetical protein [Roseibium sp. RKSG952]|uniref:hypothetical protein n=1 Tax=Roseibium sp. RKSG952 TaxID=2529384 RepID=UPI0012BD37AD|nr:hypothetical protein [Roseibium sp. RKSG952]MTH98014.1 hypothetical protein [Roseibium sp. RKSG952]
MSRETSMTAPQRDLPQEPSGGAAAPAADGDLIMAQVDKAYWLLEGEVHLYAMLAGKKPYPTPVRCVQFASMAQLAAALPEEGGVGALWSINPAIADRLRRDNELIISNAPDHN